MALALVTGGILLGARGEAAAARLREEGLDITPPGLDVVHGQPVPW